MTLPNLVSFSGYSRAGKRSAAEVLGSRARFATTYMSKPMEQALLRMNPWIVDNEKLQVVERFATLHEMLGYDELKTIDEVLRLMRILRSQFGGAVWADQTFKEIQEFRARERNVALSGVRYVDELERVRKQDGVCVWIDRPGIRPVNSNRDHDMVHANDCDIVVVNDGTVKDLYVKIVVALEEFNSEEQ